MGFKIADCTGQDISWRTCCFFFVFNVPLWEFTSMLWVIILLENKFLTHELRSRWDRVVLRDAVIAGLIQFVLHLIQIPNFAIHDSPTPEESFLHALWFVWYTCLHLFHQLFAAYRPSYLTQRFRTLIRLSKGLLYCSVFARLKLFDTVLLPQLWFLDGNCGIYTSLTKSFPHSGCWHIFHIIGSVAQWYLL